MLSEESKDKMNKASFTRIKPKGEEELRLLLEQQLAEERRVEEDDLKQTAAEEERIKSEIDREEEMKDLMQEGGPNPRIHPDSIRYNFTTGRRPRGMTTRGDLAYQSEGDASYLKVYKGRKNTAFSTDEPPAEFRQLPLPLPLQPARLHCCKQRATTRTQQRSTCKMV